MTNTTHRVVGLMDWPAGSDLTAELVEFLQQEVMTQTDDTCVLSARIARDGTICSTPADLSQLGRDLEQLFVRHLLEH